MVSISRVFLNFSSQFLKLPKPPHRIGILTTPPEDGGLVLYFDSQATISS